MNLDDNADSGPDPVDRHVGIRIRLRRKALGMSQGDLARSLGLTFQQVQKYECAANRVSASKLWGLARALSTSISHFYVGLDETQWPQRPCADADALQEFLRTAEGHDLGANFHRIRCDRVRRQIIELVRAVASEPEPAA